MTAPRSAQTLWALSIITALGLLTLTAGPAAYAQTNQQKAERARAVAAEAAQKDALKLVAAHALPCEIVEASRQGDADAEIEGKKTAVTTFEVACKDQRGYLLYQAKNAPFGNPVDCLKAAALAKAVPGSPVCKLKSNRVMHYWLGPIAKTKLPACQIGGARWIGPDASKEKDIYEVACKGTAGGIFTVPGPKAKDQTPGYLNCLKTEATSLACQLTPPELAAQTLSGEIRKNAPGCTISNARFVGATKDAEYYEIGCQDKAGFIMATDTQGKFNSAIGCDKAAAVGGCKFTDTVALAAAGKARQDETKAKLKDSYTQSLTMAGIVCTIEDFRRIGRDSPTHRDLAEFKCKEQALGLVALIPDAGTTSTLASFDCFAAAAQKLECTLTAKDQLKAHLQNLSTNHKSIKPDCVIGEVRYAFENNGQVVMEIACTNKRGYIGVLNKARSGINPAVPCHIAATNPGVPEKCTIAGNGTNKSA